LFIDPKFSAKFIVKFCVELLVRGKICSKTPSAFGAALVSALTREVPNRTSKMTKKRKGKATLEFLRYPGLGFVLDESSPAPAAGDRAFGVHFVPPAAYVSSLVSKGRPEEGATNIDVPLSPWTHGVKEELCSDAPTTVPLPEEENLDHDTKGEPRQEDPLIYMPQELKIPLRKDGQPGMWCMYHRSDRHRLEDC